MLRSCGDDFSYRCADSHPDLKNVNDLEANEISGRDSVASLALEVVLPWVPPMSDPFTRADMC